MENKILAKVTEIKTSGQRRVTIPKEDKTLKEGDLVEIKKVKIN